jgi:hypothetical protein
MIDPNKVHGKKVALIAWAKDEKGEDDVAVFTGTGRWIGDQLSLDRGVNETAVAIPNEWLDRLQIVTPDLKKTLLDSDYSISISVGNLTNADRPSELDSLGLKWPN